MSVDREPRKLKQTGNIPNPNSTPPLGGELTRINDFQRDHGRELLPEPVIETPLQRALEAGQTIVDAGREILTGDHVFPGREQIRKAVRKGVEKSRKSKVKQPRIPRIVGMEADYQIEEEVEQEQEVVQLTQEVKLGELSYDDSVYEEYEARYLGESGAPVSKDLSFFALASAGSEVVDERDSEEKKAPKVFGRAELEAMAERRRQVEKTHREARQMSYDDESAAKSALVIKQPAGNGADNKPIDTRIPAAMQSAMDRISGININDEKKNPDGSIDYSQWETTNGFPSDRAKTLYPKEEGPANMDIRVDGIRVTVVFRAPKK